MEKIAVLSGKNLNNVTFKKDGEVKSLNEEDIILKLEWERETEIYFYFGPYEGFKVEEKDQKLFLTIDGHALSVWEIRSRYHHYSLFKRDQAYLTEKILQTLSGSLKIGGGGDGGTLGILDLFFSGMIQRYESDIVTEETRQKAISAAKAFADIYMFKNALGIAKIFFYRDWEEQSRQEIDEIKKYIVKKRLEYARFLKKMAKEIKNAIKKGDIVPIDEDGVNEDEMNHIHFDINIDGTDYHGKMWFSSASGVVETCIGTPPNPIVGAYSAEDRDEYLFKGPIKDWTYIEGPKFKI